MGIRDFFRSCDLSVGILRPGVLTGPYCPVYGFGAMALLLCLYRLMKTRILVCKIPITPVLVLLESWASQPWLSWRPAMWWNGLPEAGCGIIIVLRQTFRGELHWIQVCDLVRAEWYFSICFIPAFNAVCQRLRIEPYTCSRWFWVEFFCWIVFATYWCKNDVSQLTVKEKY